MIEIILEFEISVALSKQLLTWKMNEQENEEEKKQHMKYENNLNRLELNGLKRG